MKGFWQAAVLVGTLTLAGCATPGTGTRVAAFQTINLKADLDPAVLARYRAATPRASDAGGTCHMATLEETNWWPLGLLLFWHRGSVQSMPGEKGRTVYMVSQTRGFGPLSVLYVSREDATFDADGRLLADMSMGSVLWGHLAMFHGMRFRLDGDTWMTHSTSHWLHHAISVLDMNGVAGVSLFSAPNPVGFRD